MAFVVLMTAAEPGIISAQNPPTPTPAPFPAGQAWPDPKPALNWALQVESDPRLAKPQADFVRDIAAKLNAAKIGIPNDRIRHFKQFISPNSNPVEGWHGMIEFIAPKEEGLLVTIRVRADQGRHFDSASLMEQYLIANGTVTYVGSFLPPPYHRVMAGF